MFLEGKTDAVTLGLFFVVKKGWRVLCTSICAASSTTWKRISKMSTLPPPWKNVCGRPWLWC